MKVVLTDYGFPHIDQERALITGAGHELVVPQTKVAAEIVAAAHDADALIVQWAPITREVIAGLTRCRVIVRYGIGVDNIDLRAAGEKGIFVCNIPDYCIAEVADHSVALALSLARQIPQTDAVVRSGTWKITPPTSFPAFRDRTFATAGFGRIARAVLARAKVFGFKLAAYDPFVNAGAFAEAGVKKLELPELIRDAGLLSLHLPLTDETKHFLSAATLARMRPDAIIVNTARGGLIDNVALAEALEHRLIAGAGIDVFEQEPLPTDHPLRRAPNTILTSHTAWFSGGSVPVLQRRAAEIAIAALAGQPLTTVVNKNFLPPSPPATA